MKNMSAWAIRHLVSPVVLFVVLFAKPLGGWVSDRTGRRRLMLSLTVAVMALIYFAHTLMLNGPLSHFLWGQVMMAVPLGMALGLQGAMVVEIFPLRTRVTSMSFAYSVTLMLAGGITPFVSTLLIDNLGEPTAPAFFAMIYGAIGLPIMFAMRETNTRSLDD